MPSQQTRGVRHGVSQRTRFRNPLDFKWISDFRMDFWISKWISGFQSGFLDFKVDFWISKRISGFQSGFLEGFLDFKRISGFQSGFLDFKVDFSRDFWISSEFLDFKADFWISFEHGYTIYDLNRYYSKIQLKYTHDSSTAFLSACMLTEYKVTGISPLHSAQACSLSYIYAYCDHKYSACSLLIHNVVLSPDPTLLAGRHAWAGHEHT